jgi:hypothetical protein
MRRNYKSLFGCSNLMSLLIAYCMEPSDLICSVGFGCHACELAKLFTQMTVAIESTQESDVRNGAIAETDRKIVILAQELGSSAAIKW